MNKQKKELSRRKAISRTHALALSLMVMTVFLCGSCDLLGDLTGFVEPDDYEPNNTLNEAFSTSQGESYNAYIAENDADYFSFTTTHGSTTYDEVEITIQDVGEALIIGLAVYDGQGELIAQTNADTEGAILSYTLRDLHSDDPYTVRFSGTWGDGWTVDGIGDHDSEGPYTFTINNVDANDEYAGNHTLNDAVGVSTGQTYNGVLVSEKEADFFSFTPTSENMQLQVTNVGSNLIFGVAIYFPNFEEAGTFNANTEGANFTLDLTSMNTEVTYYLRFSGTWGDGWTVDGIGDHTGYGPYTFTLVDN